MFTRLLRQLIRIATDRRGGVSVMLALMLVPLVGVMGLATETASWYFFQRAAQNAADAAAMAAAANNCATASVCGTATYADEAKAVSAKYNFIDGADNTTVLAENQVACPSPSTDNNCYRVTVSRKVPIYLTQVVGYTGNDTIGTTKAVKVVASAMARPKGQASGYCLIGLGAGKKDGITMNGIPKADLPGCDLFSNSDLTCNGGNPLSSSPYGYAVGTSSCGANQKGGQTAISDPFASLSASPPIPDHIASCGGKFSGGSLSAISTTDVWGCGDTTLTKDLVVTTANTTITIYNGSLNLGGHTLSTSGSGSLTIIFSGTSTSVKKTIYNHFPTGFGTISIAAPSSGVLHGVAIMQDKRLVGSSNVVDFSLSGSTTLNVQGLIYMPNASFTLGGAINKFDPGVSCAAVIAKSITISGGGYIFPNSTTGTTDDCNRVGLTDLPQSPDIHRQGLVL